MTSSRALSSRPLVLLFAAGLAQAADPALLPLDAGTYVVASYSPCNEAPLAGVVQFDGHAFLGPHESDCRSVVRARTGASYRVETRCQALGDGTPATPSTQVTTVRVTSRTSMILTHDHADVAYALCPRFR